MLNTKALIHFTVAMMLSLTFCGTYAGPPKKRSLAGLEIGSTMEQVRQWALQAYPKCKLEFTPATRPEQKGVKYESAKFSVKTGTKYDTWNCDPTMGEPQPQYYDDIVVTLVNEADSLGGQAYQILVARTFRREANGVWGAYTLDETIKQLVAQFGPATFIGQTATQQTYNKRAQSQWTNEKYLPDGMTLWWGEGQFDKYSGGCKSQCKGITLEAVIYTWYDPAVDPDREAVHYVLLVLTDTDAQSREDAWRKNSRNHPKGLNGLRF